MTLEATTTRIDIWNACRSHDDHCTNCPYRFTCEEQFPYIGDSRRNDAVPADYDLMGNVFVEREV